MFFRLIKRRHVDKALVKNRLVDDAMEAYFDWRAAYMSVGDAYLRQRLPAGPTEDRVSARCRPRFRAKAVDNHRRLM